MSSVEEQLLPVVRKATRQSIPASVPSESDNSDDSDNLTDTEEDVWFPMDPQRQHLRGGIDFDELQQLIEDQREETQAYQAQTTPSFQPKHTKRKLSRLHKAAAKYVPGWARSKGKKDIELDDLSSESEKGDQVEFDASKNKVEDSVSVHTKGSSFVVPDRFALFTSANEATKHAPDLSLLIGPGESVKGLFGGEQEESVTWWLDCLCASDNEIKILAKAFGIHPLTTEDIRMQEDREKVEFFRDYYFVTFHSFDADLELEEFLEPILFYMVVFRLGVLSFHLAPAAHCINVRRRIRQLKEYIPLLSDWICYALIDNITDSFFPIINAIDYETDAIEAAAFLTRNVNFSTMLHRIGESRRKVMTLIRLLSGKADVVKMLHKRCAEPGESPHQVQSSMMALDNAISAATPSGLLTNLVGLKRSTGSTPVGGDTEVIKPREEIALFLGDIQDHILTLNMNLTSYEKILSRAYTNHLAQLQVELFNSNNRVTEMLSKFTIISVVWIPLNLCTGLFGMNVQVPGQDSSGLGWFFGILGVLLVTVCMGVVFANWWIQRLRQESNQEDVDDSRSFITRFLKGKWRGQSNMNARSVVSFA